ncbi:MAG: pilus assembly protein TadG-related protein [Hyphomicrobiaceae bacterium]
MLLGNERRTGIWRDEQGSIAIIFGLSLLLIVFAIGFSLDTAQAVRTSGKVSSALDAASLAAARALSEGNLTQAEAQAIALKYFEAQMAATDAGSYSWSNFAAVIDAESGAVTVTSDITVPTSFARILSINKVNFSKASTSIFKMRNVELAMVLDITGSMGGQKIADLKLAANDIVDIMLPAGQPALNKIALAPYAASINVGPYANLASDSASLDGCVVERNGSHAYSDDPPDSGRYFNVEDNPPHNGNYDCPSAEIFPLSDDSVALKTEIASLSADGFTAGHIGLGWGWYMISPNWTTVWPAASVPKPYADSNTIKAIILMTDGEFNTSYHNGSMNATSPEQALDICNAIKDPDVTGGNVVIYAVAFQSPPAAEATLQACATSPSHYFSADNGTELRAAFQDIAKRLQSLRLSK